MLGRGKRPASHSNKPCAHVIRREQNLCPYSNKQFLPALESFYAPADLKAGRPAAEQSFHHREIQLPQFFLPALRPPEFHFQNEDSAAWGLPDCIRLADSTPCLIPEFNPRRGENRPRQLLLHQSYRSAFEANPRCFLPIPLRRCFRNPRRLRRPLRPHHPTGH